MSRPLPSATDAATTRGAAFGGLSAAANARADPSWAAVVHDLLQLIECFEAQPERSNQHPEQGCSGGEHQPSQATAPASSIVPTLRQSINCLNSASGEIERLKMEGIELKREKTRLQEDVNTLKLQLHALKESNHELLRTTSDPGIVNPETKNAETIDEQRILLDEYQRLIANKDMEITSLKKQLQLGGAAEHQELLDDFRQRNGVSPFSSVNTATAGGQIPRSVFSNPLKQQYGLHAPTAGLDPPNARQQLSENLGPGAYSTQQNQKQIREPISSRQQQSDSQDRLFRCPVCNLELPDLDSLNVHVNECLDHPACP